MGRILAPVEHRRALFHAVTKAKPEDPPPDVLIAQIADFFTRTLKSRP